MDHRMISSQLALLFGTVLRFSLSLGVMRKFTFFEIVGLLLLAISGCAPAYRTHVIAMAACCEQSTSQPDDQRSLTIEEVSRIARGSTKHELERIFGSAGTTEFIAKISGDEIRCISYLFGHPSVLTYYYVFKNDHLAKVIERPAFAYERVLRGEDEPRVVEVRRPVDPEARLKQVIKALDLDGDALLSSLMKNFALAERRNRGMEPQNIAPALAITAPLRVVQLIASPLSALKLSHRQDLAMKFDARKTTLGMTRDAVDESYGSPRVIILPSAKLQFCVYGERLGDELEACEIVSWVVVEFEDGVVTKVFGHHFVDSQLIELVSKYGP